MTELLTYVLGGILIVNTILLPYLIRFLVAQIKLAKSNTDLNYTLESLERKRYVDQSARLSSSMQLHDVVLKRFRQDTPDRPERDHPLDRP